MMFASKELLHWLGPPWTTRKRRIVLLKQHVHKIVAIYSQSESVTSASQDKLQFSSCLYKQEISEQRRTVCFELSLFLTVKMREGIFCDITSTSSWTKWRAQEGWWDINREEDCDCYRNVRSPCAGDWAQVTLQYAGTFLPYLFLETTLLQLSLILLLMALCQLTLVTWSGIEIGRLVILKNAPQMVIHITWGWLCTCLIWVTGQEAFPESKAECLHTCTHRLTSLLRLTIFWCWCCTWLFTIVCKHSIKLWALLNAANLSKWHGMVVHNA